MPEFPLPASRRFPIDTAWPLCFLLPSRLLLSVPDSHQVHRKAAAGWAGRSDDGSRTDGGEIGFDAIDGRSAADHRRWGIAPRPEG